MTSITYAPVLQEVVAGVQVTEAIANTPFDNTLLFFGFALAMKVTDQAPPTTVMPLPGLKRRVGVNFGPGPPSGDEAVPSPGKIALGAPPEPLQPSVNVNTAPN